MIKRAANSGARALSRVQTDFQRFIEFEVSGGLTLLAAAAIAIVAANSVYAESYHALWETELAFSVGSWHFSETLLHWIDDGLMALFFFVVGLEIKREVLVGELSSIRKAALPIIAALGGMLVPAGIYLLLNRGGEGATGWGIPMATDIAFALGVLALLGSRVPAALKLFLTAVAIADDIGAVLVIAMFYTAKIHWAWLGFGFALLLVLVLFNVLDVDNPLPYFLVAAVIWFAFLHSGVHATIAGVLVALTIPATARLKPMDFVNLAQSKIDEIAVCDIPDSHVLEDPAQQHCAFEIAKAASHTAAPLQRLEHALLPFTTFIILPLFALANAGVTLTGYDLSVLAVQPVTIGIFAGLLVGKTVGISAATWCATKLGIADLPAGVGWHHVIGASLLGGIGFTMSLFVSNLAFRGELLLAEAKFAILVTSLLAGVIGYVYLRWVAARAPGSGGTTTRVA